MEAFIGWSRKITILNFKNQKRSYIKNILGLFQQINGTVKNLILMRRYERICLSISLFHCTMLVFLLERGHSALLTMLNLEGTSLELGKGVEMMHLERMQKHSHR